MSRKRDHSTGGFINLPGPELHSNVFQLVYIGLLTFVVKFYRALEELLLLLRRVGVVPNLTSIKLGLASSDTPKYILLVSWCSYSNLGLFA